MKRQFFDLRVGETVEIGNSRVTAEAKTGSRIRIKVESDEPTRRGSTTLPQPNTTPPASTLKRPGT